MKTAKIYIVVVTYNRLNYLKELIDALKKQTQKYSEIVVVNNSSTDGTKEWLSTQKDIKVINQDNLGGAGGFHTGMKYSYENSAEWIWIMDDDVIPVPNCLEVLLSSEDKNLIRAAFRLNPDGKPSYNDAISYNLNNPFSSFWKEILSEKHLNKNIIYATGATFEGVLFNREVINKIGLPIKEYFIFADDTEYFIRAEKAGFRIAIFRDAILNRKLNPAQYVDFSWKHYYVIRNQIATDVIHGTLFVRLIRPWIYLLKWLFKAKKTSDYRAVIKAFIDGYFIRFSITK